MSETLKEDKEGQFSSIVKPSDELHMDEDGNISKALIDDLREFKAEELLNLEESIKNARLPTEDLFGIKRRFCKVCEKGCTGYLPNTLMVPQPGEFPTFCKNCKCPAHFHNICVDPEDIAFPEDLKVALQNHNITSKDLNFNCIMLAFQVRDPLKRSQNTTELIQILKEEGLEIVSIETRNLEIEEAIYLKSRMVCQTENMVLQSLGVKHGGRANEIRKDAQHGSAFLGKHGATDPFLLNKHADLKEARMIQMAQKIQGEHQRDHLEHIPGVSLKPTKPLGQSMKPQGLLMQDTFVTDKSLKMTADNLNGAHIFDTINQRGNLMDDGGNSIARTSTVNEHPELQAIEDTIAQVRRDTIMPMRKDKTFKVKQNPKTKTQIKRKLGFLQLDDYGNDEIQETILIQQLERDPLLTELISKEVILIAVSSSTFQNLNHQIKKTVVPKFHVFLPPQEMPMLYISESKIMALEDCILFFPVLFKLTKSIVVSEPLSQTPIDCSRPGKDVASNIQLALRGKDSKNSELQEKLQILQQNNESSVDMMENDLDEENEINFKNRSTLRLKTSAKLKTMLMKRDTLRKSQRLQSMPTFGENQKEAGLFGEHHDESWMIRAREREKRQQKKVKLLSQHNKVLYNFGVLHDFFNYSAMSIQNSMHEVDLQNPPAIAAANKDNGMYAIRSEMMSSAGSSGLPQVNSKSNIFAIAKVGLPNLILPSSLDLKLSNFNNYSAYLQLCDGFFPKLSTSQHSILVLRPLIVKNGLNDYLVQMLKINDFTILKRKVRMLSKAEIAFLAESEGIKDDACDAYFNLMMQGEVEVVTVTKFGAVSDLKSLVNGSAPHGRRRLAQLDEDTSAVRTNVDAVNSMFEITPFTSMSEFLDLEDFIISHSKLEKYKKNRHTLMNRMNEELYFYKVDQIRKEINMFSRYFNFVAHAPESEVLAQKEMCVLMPEVAIIEEVIIMLNPIYNIFIEAIDSLLFRMGFKTLNRKLTTITDGEAHALFKEKINIGEGTASQSGSKLAKLISNSQVYLWHLTKLSGDRELRQLYRDAQVELEDMLRLRVKTTPFKPQHLPFMFLFMDTPNMFEIAYRILWTDTFTDITGQLLIDVLDAPTRRGVLELALQVTVGDKIKELCFDRDGNIVNPITVSEETHMTLSKIPQIFQLFCNPRHSTAVHTIVESESHGLYEMRFTRLPHRGDLYSLGVNPASIDMEKLRMRYFTKFQSLNIYYNEVNKHFYNICPAFYRFKICPMDATHSPVNRVYEVEEYMGRTFIEVVANMHHEHIRTIRANQAKLPMNIGKNIYELLLDSDQQKSMPAYVWGAKLADLCQSLQKIKGNSAVQGAGRLIFQNNQLRGEVSNSQDYFQFDKQRFERYLADFRKGWGYYLSALECDLIESKLTRILESETFKKSRQPGNLALLPDRLQEINLRISEKLHLLVEKSLEKGSRAKFYEHLTREQLDPDHEERTVNMVQSVMHTLYLENARTRAFQRRLLDNNAGKGFKLEDIQQMKADQDQKNNYSVHKALAVVGMDIAKRPKHHLVASILYLVNFFLRKVERRAELFADLERQRKEDPGQLVEQVYDQVLDIVVGSLKENYGKDEFNLAIDTSGDQQVFETDFERKVKRKQELEMRLRKLMEQRVEEEMRLRRCQMSFEELLQSIQAQDSRVHERKQQEALRKFVEQRGYMDQHGDGFLSLLKQTQQYLGPFAIKMAHDHLRQIEMQRKHKRENISFVKMEYFLYCVTEAHRCVLELRQSEVRLNELLDEHERASIQLGGMMPNHSKTYEQQMSMVEQLAKTVEHLRYQISQRESELLMIFRELKSWDYYVSDYKLEKEHSLVSKESEADSYLLPLRTFWKPVYFDGYQESDILHPGFAMRIRDFSGAGANPATMTTIGIPKLANDDQTLAKEEQKKETTPAETTPRWQPAPGVFVSCLRPYDAKTQTDFLKFDKYFSNGEMNEKKELERIKTAIQVKLTRELHDFGMRFQSTSQPKQ